MNSIITNKALLVLLMTLGGSPLFAESKNTTESDHPTCQKAIGAGSNKADTSNATKKNKTSSKNALTNNQPPSISKESEGTKKQQPLSFDPQSPEGKALQAGPAFLTYFNSVSQRILERDEILPLVQMAWISKEHILMVGPPGNAKTTLAKTLMANVKDKETSESSFFSLQMTPETTLSDTHGGVNYRVLSETGRQERLYDESILGSHFGLFDETFDMRANGIRNVLDVLAERAHSQGNREYKGKTWSVMGASNTYLPEVFALFNGSDRPRALIDRYAFVIYIPAEMELIESHRTIIKGAHVKPPPLPELTFQDIEALQDLVTLVDIPDHVSDLLAHIHWELRPLLEGEEQAKVDEFEEALKNGEKPLPPYRSTKLISPRTMGKAAAILKSAVVLDFIKKKGQRSLVASIKDLEVLKNVYALNGPTDRFAEVQFERAAKKMEREQLRILKFERQLVNELFDTNTKDFQKELLEIEVPRFHQQVMHYAQLEAAQRRTLMDSLAEMYREGLRAQSGLQVSQSVRQIAKATTVELVEEWAKMIEPHRYQFILNLWKEGKTAEPSQVNAKKALKQKWANLPSKNEEKTDGFSQLVSIEKELLAKKNYENNKPERGQEDLWELPKEWTKHLKVTPNSNTRLLSHHLNQGIYFLDTLDYSYSYFSEKGTKQSVYLDDLHLGKDVIAMGPFLKRQSDNFIYWLGKPDQGTPPLDLHNGLAINAQHSSQEQRTVSESRANSINQRNNDPSNFEMMLTEKASSNQQVVKNSQKFQKVFFFHDGIIHGFEKASKGRDPLRTEKLAYDREEHRLQKTWQQRTIEPPYSYADNVLLGAPREYKPYETQNIGDFTLYREGQINGGQIVPSHNLYVFDHVTRQVTNETRLLWLATQPNALWFTQDGHLNGYKYSLVKESQDKVGAEAKYSILFEDGFDSVQLYLQLFTVNRFLDKDKTLSPIVRAWREGTKIHVALLIQGPPKKIETAPQQTIQEIYEAIYEWEGPGSGISFVTERIQKLPGGLIPKGVYLERSETNTLFLYGYDLQKQLRVYFIKPLGLGWD